MAWYGHDAQAKERLRFTRTWGAGTLRASSLSRSRALRMMKGSNALRVVRTIIDPSTCIGTANEFVRAAQDCHELTRARLLLAHPLERAHARAHEAWPCSPRTGHTRNPEGRAS